MMYCVGAVHSDLRSTAISHIGYVRRGSVPYFVVRTQGENRGWRTQEIERDGAAIA